MGRFEEDVSLSGLLHGRAWGAYEEMRHKADIEHKLRELSDQYLFLRKNGKTPITADEFRLKAEALRWVLSLTDTL